MNEMFWVNVVMRWLHVASAVVGLGVIILIKLVLVPALRGKADGGELYNRLQPALKTVVHSALGTALLTGLYNYVMVTIPVLRARRELGTLAAAFGAYHPVMGVKILLSLALFGIGAVLVKPVPQFNEKQDTLSTLGMVLGFGVLLAGAFLRRLWNL